MSIWLCPLITALVAGDIVATETHNGTLKTILTRSRERGEVFAGKVLAPRPTRSRSCSRWALVGLDRRLHRLGLRSAHVAVGHRVSAGPRAAAARREPRVYTPAARRDRGIRRAALDRHAQQRRVGRRHADVLAAACSCSACCPGTEASGPTCSERSSTPGTASCASRSTGRRRARALGLRALHRGPAVAAYLVFLRRDVAGD